MAEPITTTQVATGMSLAALLPFINGDSLLGAVLGASLVASQSADHTAKQRITAFIMSIFIGYVLAFEIVDRTLITSYTTAAFITSIFMIPIINKGLDWVKKMDFKDFIKIFKGG